MVTRFGRLWAASAALLLAGLALASGPVSARGQNVSARTLVNPNPVGVNQRFTVSVEVRGVQGLAEELPIPPVEAFARYAGQGTSTSAQVVNGTWDVRTTVEFRFFATEEGEFEIPAMEVTAGGQTVTTEPVSLTITADPAPVQGGEEAGVTVQDIFLTAEPSKERVYPNEPLMVEYRIFTRLNVESYSVVSPPNTEGFWAEEIPLPDGPVVEQRVRDGISYTTAVIRRVALFPTGPGTKTLDRFTIEARVRVQRRSRSLLDGFFGGGILATTEPVTVSSEPLEIEVLELPDEGRPESFTGVVGSLEASASVDRNEVEANEALTLTLHVSGEGNLRSLPTPELALDTDFEVFEPEVTESLTRNGDMVRGSKTYSYVLIPRAPGTRTLPPVELGYFDPEAGRYAVASSAPITLEVTGEASSLSGSGVRSGVETLREDIRFIQLGAPGLRLANRTLFDAPGFWIVALLPLLAAMGALGLRAYQDRLRGDVAWARDRRATKVARQHLEAARSLAQGGEAAEFYGEVSRALRGFLADKLNVAEAGLMADDAARRLRERGVPESLVSAYLGCLENCDRQRFAPASAGARDDLLTRAEAVLTRLAEALGR